jgi:hypothetical protein
MGVGVDGRERTMGVMEEGRRERSEDDGGVDAA